MRKRNLLILFISAIVLMTLFELVHNLRLPVAPAKPKKRISARSDDPLRKAQAGEPITLEEILAVKNYVDRRYDTSDFKLQSILRLLYLYPESLNDEMKIALRRMFLDFKYWMDEPGQDGMCYWSENHQILFAAAEYLAGQLYPDEIFSNASLTGRQHMAKARKRILTWLEQRWKYGFTEWYSNVYYVEDIAPMANLIDFAGDEEIVTKTKIIMDLLLYDMASQSWRGHFVTTMGRSYEGGKKSGRKASTRAITAAVFGLGTSDGRRSGMDLNFLDIRNYEVPQVIRAIGRDTSVAVVRASNGLSLDELVQKGMVGQSDEQIMMQWGMEAFSNPAVLANSMNYARSRDMLANQFLYQFRHINFSLIRWLNLYKPIHFLLRPQSDGSAIQRANTYTFKTPHFSMYTAMSYHPGEYGDQHHVFGVNLADDLSVFHTHPAVLKGEKPVGMNSPTYWVGYGRLPHSVQHQNINLSIYRLPKRKNLMERRMLHFTHLYFPEKQFDQVVLNRNKVFGKKGKVQIAFIAKNNLEFDSDRTEILQKGKNTFWICEVSTTDQESFEEFVRRIEGNEVTFDRTTLIYKSKGKELSLTFGSEFLVDGKTVDTNYPRYDSPWIKAPREPEHMTFRHGQSQLYLDFDGAIRREIIVDRAGS